MGFLGVFTASRYVGTCGEGQKAIAVINLRKFEVENQVSCETPLQLEEEGYLD